MNKKIFTKWTPLKKWIILISSLLIIFLSTFLLNSINGKQIIFIQYHQLNKIMAKEPDFFLVISKNNCDFCQELKNNSELANQQTSNKIFIYLNMSKHNLPKL